MQYQRKTLKEIFQVCISMIENNPEMTEESIIEHCNVAIENWKYEQREINERDSIKVTATVRSLINKGYWEKFCLHRGINPWSVNEGLLDSSHEFTLSKEEAIKYGYIQK